jgi:hypothetical protein
MLAGDLYMTMGSIVFITRNKREELHMVLGTVG